MKATQCDVFTYIASLVRNYTSLQLDTIYLVCAPYLSVVQTYVLIYEEPFIDLQIYYPVLYNHY